MPVRADSERLLHAMGERLLHAMGERLLYAMGERLLYAMLAGARDSYRNITIV